MSLVVRFNEVTRYDITQDRDVVCFMGVTDRGTYHTEIPVLTTRHLREKRNEFKENVVRFMESGVPPCEVQLG